MMRVSVVVEDLVTEELAGAAVTPCKEDSTPLPHDATGHPDGPLLELV